MVGEKERRESEGEWMMMVGEVAEEGEPIPSTEGEGECMETEDDVELL